MTIRNKNTLCVTGGTGFVGAAVCRAGLRKGFRVVSVSRTGATASNYRTLPPEMRFVASAIADSAGWASELSDCLAVIHCVGILFQNRRKNLTHIQTTIGTARSAAQIARSEGVEIFALVSAHKSPPPLHNYSRAKALAEQAVQKLFPNALIFRAGVLTGDHKWWTKPLAWFLPASVAQDVDVFADTLIDAIVTRARQ